MTGYLYHHGIKGQKWGVRRYQNTDGSLTSAGRSRYGVGEADGSSSGQKMSRAARAHMRKADSYQRAYNRAAGITKIRNKRDVDAANEWKEIEKHNPKHKGEYAKAMEKANRDAAYRKEADEEWKTMSDVERRRGERTQEYHDNAKKYWKSMSTGHKVGAVMLYGLSGAQHYSALKGSGASTTSAAGQTILAGVLGGPIGHTIMNNIDRSEYARADDEKIESRD